MRKLPAVVGERVEHDGRVLAGLDDLVEVADRALPDGSGERTVDPTRVATLEQVAADEIGGREVVVTCDGDERPTEVVGHRLDEAGLAATGRPLEQHRQTLTGGGLEDLLLVADRYVERALLTTRRRHRSSSRVRDVAWFGRCAGTRAAGSRPSASAARNSGPITTGS